jgi:hypothetical protein
MPCKNGGTCIDQVNGFDCQCPERVIIESLEEEITVEFDHFSDERCGICLDSTTYGKQCQLKCPCLNEQPCYWNQTQRQVVCDCDANYFVGPQCQQEINAKDATIYYIVVSVLLFVFVSGCLVSCKIYAKNQTCFLCTEACFDWCWCGRSRPGRIWVASVLSNTNLNDGLPSTGAVTKEIPKESKDLMTPASSSETNHKTTIVIGSTPSILETDPDSTLLPPFPQPITTEGVATTMTHESVAQAAIKAQESVAPNSQVSLQKPLTLEQLTQL